MQTTILHHGALGDWMLVMPMIRALTHHAPAQQNQTHTILAGQSHDKAALAQRLIPQALPLVVDTPAWATLFSPNADPPAHVIQILQNSSRIISFLSDGSDDWSRNVRRIAPDAKLHCIHARPTNTATNGTAPGQHITAYHAAQLAAQGLKYTPAFHSPSASASPLAPILIHPGSGGKEKCWPAILWESFIAHAQNDGWHLLPVLGEVELDTWPAATVTRWTRQFGAVACNNLDELCNLLSTSRGLIGLDAGPSHLAAVMNLPVIALYGPTSPAIWSPFGKHVHIIAPVTPSPMSWLQPERVKEAMERAF